MPSMPVGRSLLVVILALAGSCRVAGEEPIRLHDLREPFVFGDGDAETVLRATADALATGVALPARLPRAVADDRLPRVAFLSVSDGRGPARVNIGRGRGLGRALAGALAGIQTMAPEFRTGLWIKLDLITSVKPATTVPLTAGTRLDLERGLEGLAVGGSTEILFLPEEIVGHRLLDAGRLNVSAVTRCLRYRSEPASAATFLRGTGALSYRRFATESYFLGGDGFVRLYRGHRLASLPTSAALLEAARQGGHYLRRAVRPDGSFVYLYLPTLDLERDDYNMVRHAGTVYSMLDLYETTRDEKLLEASERAIAFLMRFVKPFGAESQRVSVMTHGGKIKLGGVALTAVALAEHVLVTGSRRHLPVAQRLGRYIQASQLKSGGFIHQRTYPGGDVRLFESQYYPGEALLALMRVYAVDRRETWLDTAEKGAKYLIEVRDRGIAAPDLIHDHWLLYALNELHRHRPRALFLEQAARISKAIALKQRRAPEFPDHAGSYHDPPRSTPTATRVEGLLAAHALFRDFDRPAEAAAALETIRLSAGFQLLTQVTPERALYLRDPLRALGGFTHGLTNFEIRIDYVQHNISALIGLYRIVGADG